MMLTVAIAAGLVGLGVIVQIVRFAVLVFFVAIVAIVVVAVICPGSATVGHVWQML